MSDKKRVALVMGGKSNEREVSLASGKEVLAHIDKNRFEVSIYDPATDLGQLVDNAGKLDLAFLCLHGRYGEDGTIQGLCEMVGLPYTGSGVLASAMAMDKEIAKRIFRDAGLPVAPDLVVRKESVNDLQATAKMALFSLGNPVVVKPLCSGSSVGLSIVDSEEQLSQALAQAFEIDGAVMLEKYLPGKELTCAVVGNNSLKALPPIEIIPAHGHRFFDYAAKYEPGQAQEICPAEVHKELLDEVQRLSISAHTTLGCRGMSRTDLIFSFGNTYILETNTIPGMTSGSLLPKMARAYGLSFGGFISYIIDLALTGENLNIDVYKD